MECLTLPNLVLLLALLLRWKPNADLSHLSLWLFLLTATEAESATFGEEES